MAPSISHYVSAWKPLPTCTVQECSFRPWISKHMFWPWQEGHVNWTWQMSANNRKWLIRYGVSSWGNMTEWRNTVENPMWKGNCITQLTTCTVLVSYYRVNNVHAIACHCRMRNPHIRCHNLSKSMRQIMRVAASMHVLFWLKDEKPLPRTISHKAINTAIDNVEVCYQQIAYIASRGKICDKINMS